MSNRQPGDWKWFIIIVGTFAVVWSAALILTAGGAKADVGNKQSEYGGTFAPCGHKQIRHAMHHVGMDSHTVRYCRNHGWVIRPHTIVTPFGEADTDLPKCTQEDSQHCYWNALHRGNHRGEGYISLTGRLIRVDFINGKRASNHIYGYYAIVPNGI